MHYTLKLYFYFHSIASIFLSNNTFALRPPGESVDLTSEFFHHDWQPRRSRNPRLNFIRHIEARSVPNSLPYMDNVLLNRPVSCCQDKFPYI